MNNNPIVTICCLSYNHEEYIRKTIEGFLNQNIQFPFDILIHDDCSFDGTQDILKEYSRKYENIRVLFEKENQFSKGVNIAFDIMLPEIRGKYIAICEGDDYWTNSEKLKKQIEFMEDNNNCVLTVHNGIRYDAIRGRRISVEPFKKTGYLTAHEMLMSFAKNPPTASFVLRRDILNNYPVFLKRAPVVDDVLKLYSFTKGDVYYFSDIMCFRYYRHSGSWNKMLEEDYDLYRNYVTGIIDFYYAFNEYTNGVHESEIHIIIKKIKRRYEHITGDVISFAKESI